MILLLLLQCSYIPKCRSEYANAKSVKKYQDANIVPGIPMKCYYNPAIGSTEVFQHLPVLNSYHHFWLWPCATILVSSTVAGILYFICGCSPEHKNKELVQSLRQKGITHLTHFSPESKRRMVTEFDHHVDSNQVVFNPPPIIEIVEEDDEKCMTTTV